jgi:hypothetical protein
MFVWRYLGAEGEEAGRSELFPDRAAAEAWLSESWSRLWDLGVHEVVLMDETDSRDLYRMSLSE